MTKPAQAQFVHLHNHSEYSLLDGATRLTDDKGNPSEFIRTMVQMGYPALALTDHGNLFGAVEFYRVCTEAGIKPIVGIEAYLAPRGRVERQGTIGDAAYHLTLLSTNEEGYRNLLKLTSAAYLEGYYYKPRIDKELLARHSKGLVGLSGCLKGEIPSLLLSNNPTGAYAALDQYLNIFGRENFYLEVMDHDIQLQKQLAPMLLEMSQKSGVPLVATNDCHYFRKDDAFAHDVLLCIGTGKILTDEKRMKYGTPEFYYKTPDEMIKRFGHLPGAIHSTMEVAEKSQLKLKFDQLLLPRYEVPEGQTPDTYLKDLCLEGLKKRNLSHKQEYQKRLEEELSVIYRMGFSTYFLIVWDFIQYARREKIPVGPGRGSGAGSLVAYALAITSVDPLVHGLLFERFLNPDRRTMPDLDIDFSDEGREHVIEYVRHKYGTSCVAQIITFGSMLARLVVRDVGRVLDMPLTEVDRIARMIPHELGITVHAAIAGVPELKEAYRVDPQVKKLLDLAQRLEGLKRHTGVHAAGTVIAPGDITDHVPLAKGSRNVVTTQFNDESLLKLGLLKIDFLGLRTLTVIRNACDLVRKRHKPDLDIETIPMEDETTFKFLVDAKTVGVFQLESSGMRDLLRKLKPTNLTDIVALISLYRPGPMRSGMLDEFVSRKHAKSKVRYDHKLLEPILGETYGIIVYQEQVMQVARALAGFTPGQADTLRKAMGKKIPEELERYKDTFVEGAKEKGIEKAVATKIYELMAHFGGYGFNKSHATAYGLIAYQTAFLKANYPVEYMCAVLTSEIGRSNLGSKEEDSRLVIYLREAGDMGLTILPPDIQKSVAVFSVEDNAVPQKAELGRGGIAQNGSPVPGPAIRFGLLAVKNVGEGAVESIMVARAKDGPFRSLEDFCSRVDTRQVNRKVVESLVKAGAFDGFGDEAARTRAGLMNVSEEALTIGSRIKADLEFQQGSLFSQSDLGRPEPKPTLDFSKVEPWHDHALLANEKEVLGLYFSGHPLSRYLKEISAYTTHTLGKLPESGIVRVAGIILNVRRVTTKSGQGMARFKIEDIDDEIECLVFPKSLTPEVSQVLVPHELVVVKGRVQQRLDTREIIVENVTPLKDARLRMAQGIDVHFSAVGMEEVLLSKLKKVFEAHPGVCQVNFLMTTPQHGKVVLKTQYRVKPSDDLLEKLEGMLGRSCWTFSRPQ